MRSTSQFLKTLFKVISTALFSVAAFAQQTDLQLPELLSLAQKTSPLTQAAALDSQAARADLDLTRSAFFPKIASNIAASWLAIPPGDFSIPPHTIAPNVPATELVIQESPDFDFRLELGLQQPIFTWGKLFDAAAIAESGLEAALLREDKQGRELERSLTKAYLGLNFAVQTAQQLEQMTLVYTQIYEDRQRNFEQGIIAREQLLDAASQLASLRQSRTAAFAAVARALDGIRALSGLGQSLALDLPGYSDGAATYLLELAELAWNETRLPALIGLEVAEMAQSHKKIPQILQQLQAMARERSEDIRLADLASRQADLAVEITKKKDSLFPDIGLSINLGVNGSKLPGAENWDESWSATLTVTLGTSIVITDGGAGWARNRAAQAQAGLAGLQSTNSRTSLDADVAAAVESALTAYFQAQASMDALAYGEERLKNAQISFENQLITREQVLGAELALIQRRLDLAAALFAAESSVADLEFFIVENVQ